MQLGSGISSDDEVNDNVPGGGNVSRAAGTEDSTPRRLTPLPMFLEVADRFGELESMAKEAGAAEV